MLAPYVSSICARIKIHIACSDNAARNNIQCGMCKCQGTRRLQRYQHYPALIISGVGLPVDSLESTGGFLVDSLESVGSPTPLIMSAGIDRENRQGESHCNRTRRRIRMEDGGQREDSRISDSRIKTNGFLMIIKFPV
jgi:hypothetical protein